MGGDKVWFEDPSYLLKFRGHNIIAKEQLTYVEWVNFISQIIILLTFVGFILTKKHSYIFVGGVTLLCVYILYSLHKKRRDNNKEGFNVKSYMDSDSSTTVEELKQVIQNECTPIKDNNPFGNVLMTDIGNKPTRKPAPPASDPNTHKEIIGAIEGSVQKNNPDINVSKDVFGDDSQKFMLDRSTLAFHTMPSTTIPNSQGGFSQFLYGTMGSCKEHGIFNCGNPTSN